MLALAEDDAVALGEALRAAGYAEGSSILGSSGDAVLRRLWSVGSGVPRLDVERALGARLVEALAHAGIVEADGERVRSTFRVTALEGLLFLHDRADPQGPGDQVAAVGPASATLAKLMVRRPVQRALDLGTGCGVQALVASRFAEQVVATDVNERALATAAINARLNGITNVELRRGDLFEPVRGEAFDLIATNPPFVISPETSQVYRDSGLEGDSLSKQVVGLAAEHLAPGGFATILCEWIVRAGDEWVDAPRGWVADGGCDALVLHYRTADPEAYATGWNMQLRAADPDAYADAVESWAAYQRGLGAVGVSTGAVILRRPVDGAGWFRAEEMPTGPQGAASDQILRLFASQDTGELLGAVLEPVDGQVLTQLLVRREGTWTTPDVEVTLQTGIGTRATMSPSVVHVLLSLDGERPLGEVVDQAAQELGLDPQALRPDALAVAERLVAQGVCRVRR